MIQAEAWDGTCPCLLTSCIPPFPWEDMPRTLWFQKQNERSRSTQGARVSSVEHGLDQQKSHRHVICVFFWLALRFKVVFYQHIVAIYHQFIWQYLEIWIRRKIHHKRYYRNHQCGKTGPSDMQKPRRWKCFTKGQVTNYDKFRAYLYAEDGKLTITFRKWILLKFLIRMVVRKAQFASVIGKIVGEQVNWN